MPGPLAARCSEIGRLGLLLVRLAGGASEAWAAGAQVTRFSPQATVKRVRQVSAVFSEAMVPLGDPRAADPFDIACPEAGTGRWVDTARWVYDFARDLPGGMRCTFELRRGLRTLAGDAVSGTARFTFSTGGPSILSAVPGVGGGWIDEEQAFVLLLDAEPTEASLAQHVGFAVQGIPQRVDARVLTGEARTSILKTRFRDTPRGPVIVIQGVQRFPNKARVTLIWGKGVAAASGVLTEDEQRSQFVVRDAITVALACERENKNAGCVPITPMRLNFSAPVAPVSGTIIALDPDIPEARQRLVFEAQVLGGTARWVLDGSALGDARDVVVWGPTRGKHILALVDDHAGVLDQMRFEVRGGAPSARSAGRDE